MGQPKILFVGAEQSSWARARNFSYCTQWGLVRALRDAGAHVTFLPATWLPHARVLVGSQRYDQVWCEVVHAPHIAGTGDDLYDWLATLAPVRLAMVGEVFRNSEADERMIPELRGRREAIVPRLRRFTHAWMADAIDIADVEQTCGIPARWWLPAVPQRFVRRNPSPPRTSMATFIGGLYGERLAFLENPLLTDLLVCVTPAEEETVLSLLYDAIQATTREYFEKGSGAARKWMPKYLPFLGRHRVARVSRSSPHRGLADDLHVYLGVVHSLRRDSFSLYMRSLRSGCAVVNLPHHARTYSSRVVEGMAAGVPVISFRITERPLVDSQFEPEREILLFDRDRPDQLAEHIERLRDDRNLARHLARAASRKVLAEHTTEVRVRETLQWLEEVPSLTRASDP